MLSGIALAACGAQPEPTGSPQPTAAPDAAPGDATPAPDAPDGPDATALPAATGQPAAPAPPPGWEALTLSELGVSLYAPEGWAAEPDGTGGVTLHDPGEYAWAQLAAPQDAGNLPASATADELFAATLAAFRENGDFGEPQPVETRGGLDAVQISGMYYVLDEHLLVGVAVGDGRVIHFSGHGPGLGEDGEGAWAEMQPVFEEMFASLALAGE